MPASAFPFRFDPSECARCRGECCRGEPGYAWVGREEIRALGAHLGIGESLLEERYLRLVEGRLALRELQVVPGDYVCIFFDTDRRCCRVYPARPRQCATYPFWERFRRHPEEVLDECPGTRRQGTQDMNR